MNLLFAASAIALSFSAQTPHADHDHAPELGEVAFESSCSPSAQALLLRALGWLHSFEYGQAETTFAEAAAADPTCAIAHWGVAMSQYHPLWMPPTPAELDKGRAAVARAQAVGAPTEREKAYIAAAAAFYGDSDRLDHKTRAAAYQAAMERLHAQFPDDREAAIFYALSLVAAGAMDSDPAFKKEHQAGALLNQVLVEAPNHPGVAHYLIHSFDYPALAELALPAARRYAGIAPASPHAQHMPSHIFVRLGLWDEAIASNLASEASSRASAKALGLPDSSSERLHAMDYLAYGYLQTGRDRQAEQVYADLRSIRRVDPPAFTVAYAATAIPARLALERRRWKEAASLELPDSVRGFAPLAVHRWGEAHLHLARAVGAARSGDPAAARGEVAAMREIEQSLQVKPGEYDWRTQVAIQRQIAAAWLAHAEGRADEAARLMGAVADLDDATEKHPVTPGAILPAREQLGELYLEQGRPAEALAAFEAALERAPARLAALYGAARASRLAGDPAKAGRYYAGLAEQTREGDHERPEIREARDAAKIFAAR